MSVISVPVPLPAAGRIVVVRPASVDNVTCPLDVSVDGDRVVVQCLIDERGDDASVIVDRLAWALRLH